ncbi:MAG: HEAT repeat domain-containing protein [Planctomycetota bacterium]|nr:HEAT repeat domain-containing protein [Planctomycetota bacterium]
MPRALALFAALFCLTPSLFAQDLETVDDFKKYYRTYKESPERVEAVRALEGLDHPAVVAALVAVLPKAEPRVVDAIVLVLGGFEQREPVDALLATLAKEKKEPVRLALLRAITAGGYQPLGETVLDCLEDKSWPVRRLAVGALGATGNAAHAEAILPLCEDKEVAVRCAALDALTALRADSVRAAATSLLADESWQVRASAIAALGAVRHRDSIPLLIERLAAEEGRLVADAAGALESLTGRAFGQRLELWRKFWDSYGDTYQIPTDEELTALREKQAARKAEYEGPEEKLAYHGVQTPTRRVLFVVDVSGSMEDEMVEKERFRGKGYPSFTRMDICKTELLQTIEALEPYVEFNVAAFATEVDPWKQRLQRANVLGKTSAMDFVRKLEPIGGTSKEDLARVGLVQSANLDGGRTNTWGALAWALGIDADLKRPRDDAYELEVDTIFFLSDGKPTAGEFIDTDDIVDEVKKANLLRKVVLHTIALGPFQKSFMERLARDSGGAFVDLGK